MSTIRCKLIRLSRCTTPDPETVAEQLLLEMKKGETRKTKSIEFVIDVPIGSVKDEPEDNSRVWPAKRR